MIETKPHFPKSIIAIESLQKASLLRREGCSQQKQLIGNDRQNHNYSLKLRLETSNNVYAKL